MNPPRHCSKCGAELLSDAMGGLCPGCMARVVFRAEERQEKDAEQTVPLPQRDSTIERHGAMIGRYKLLEKIGEGGFGVVYMAEQIEPVQRKVALKVIKAGMDTKEVVARFEAERQALALMDHPNIARVLDAGTTHTGRPYFVMELVRGIPITDYCDQEKLPPTERLQLFIKVCHAVQHAHQKAIIHRDLKPSNVLVTRHDGEPVPKVIDFGIAKALGSKLTDKTLFTGFLHMVGTPVYMSPEQAELSGLDTDTRSDIYSLGVLLYELLTGATPFDRETLAKAALEEMRRIIRETEPPKPSTRLQTLGERLSDVARRRSTEPAKLCRMLRGDLDWVVMKCLEKDRKRRYETANGLAMDIERHLNCEPVVARPRSRLYEFQKTVRRHKFGFAAAGALVLALALGAVVSTWQAVRASRAEASARQERELAEAINRFLTEDLLYQATPDHTARERRITMEEVLDRAVRKLDQNAELALEPRLEATLRFAVGNTYYKLGLSSEARRHLRRAVALRRNALGPDHPETLTAQEALAWLLADGFRDFEEAVTLSRQTWQTRERVLGPDHVQTLESMDTHAGVLVALKKFDEAELLFHKCVEGRERIRGSNHLETLISLSNLGGVYLNRGELVKAESIFRDVMERCERARLMDTQDAFGMTVGLAVTLLLEGNLNPAESLLTNAIQRARTIFLPDNRITLHLQHVLLRVLTDVDRLNDAAALGQQTLDAYRRVDPVQESTGRTLLYLGRVLVMQTNYDAAQPLLREALGLFREHYPMYPELIAETANWLGAIALARGDYLEASNQMLSDPEQFFRPEAAMSIPERRAMVRNIVRLYEAGGELATAAQWQKRLEEISQIYAITPGGGQRATSTGSKNRQTE